MAGIPEIVRSLQKGDYLIATVEPDRELLDIVRADGEHQGFESPGKGSLSALDFVIDGCGVFTGVDLEEPEEGDAIYQEFPTAGSIYVAV